MMDSTGQLETTTTTTALSPVLSPMHGVRPVTVCDIIDIHTLAVSLPLHDNDDDGDNNNDKMNNATGSSSSCTNNNNNTHSSSWIGQNVDALFSPKRKQNEIIIISMNTTTICYKAHTAC